MPAGGVRLHLGRLLPWGALHRPVQGICRERRCMNKSRVVMACMLALTRPQEHWLAAMLCLTTFWHAPHLPR